MFRSSMFRRLLPFLFLFSSCVPPTSAEVVGYFVCGAGRNASNAHYKRCDTGAEYSTHCLSLKPKEMLYFDAIAPYNWQIYSYYGPLKPVKVHYRANVSDFVDPPKHGWYTVNDGIDPPPFVLSDANATSCP